MFEAWLACSSQPRWLLSGDLDTLFRQTQNSREKYTHTYLEAIVTAEKINLDRKLVVVCLTDRQTEVARFTTLIPV